MILGGGNTAFALAAKLALEGHEVSLWESKSHEASIAAIREDCQIRLTGVAGEGVATMALVTTDPVEALAAGDVLLASVPSYAHKPFGEQLLPLLESRHVLALLPGNLGSLAFARWLRESGRGVASYPLLVESDTAPYVCRRLGPDLAHIFGVVPHLGVGVFPSAKTGQGVSALEGLLGGIRTYPHVVAAGLSALNPIVHPAGVMMNAGRIERTHGEFFFYEEGVTSGVVRVIEALDVERRALAAALGLDVPSVAEAFHIAGFGPAGDLWATINGSYMLTQMKAPGSLQTRWLSEDVPFGLRTWVELGDQSGVSMPVARSLVELGDALMATNSWSGGRSLDDLGINGLLGAALRRYLEEGELD